MPDAAYFRAYRAAHRERVNARTRERRRARPRARGDRSAEYARRRSRAMCPDPLPALYPALRRGAALSFWEDELRMDLEQERQLACLEGRDPVAAVTAYRRREREWHFMACPMLAEIDADEMVC